MGDPDADFEAFVLSRRTPLLRTAVLLCAGDVGQGEDLLQEVLARAARRWKAASDNPEGYVRAALVNAAIDRGRRSRRRVQEYALGLSVERASGDRDPGDLLGERDEVAAALASLPVGQRAVLVLRYFEDLSEADAAALLGVSPGSVKSQTHRALARLRHLLARPTNDQATEVESTGGRARD